MNTEMVITGMSRNGDDTMRAVAFGEQDVPKRMVALATGQGVTIQKADHLPKRKTAPDMWMVLAYNADHKFFVIWYYNADENFFGEGDYFNIHEYAPRNGEVPRDEMWQSQYFTAEKEAYCRYFERRNRH